MNASTTETEQKFVAEPEKCKHQTVVWFVFSFIQFHFSIIHITFLFCLFEGKKITRRQRYGDRENERRKYDIPTK